QKLNTIRPTRGLEGRIKAAPSDLLIKAEWPEFNDELTSEGAEHVFTQLQGLIIAIRNIRNEYKIDPRTPITISIAAPGDATRQPETGSAGRSRRPTITPSLIAARATRPWIRQ